jgi:hypothetical protein
MKEKYCRGKRVGEGGEGGRRGEEGGEREGGGVKEGGRDGNKEGRKDATWTRLSKYNVELNYSSPDPA